MTAAQIGYMTFPYDTKSTDLALLNARKINKNPNFKQKHYVFSII